MAISFKILPEDVLLSILELGEIGPLDAVSLRETCRSLYELSNDASFWIIVARNARRLDPLPLPAFRNLETLGAVEARNTCMRYLRTKQNLESDTPRYQKHRVFFMPEGSEWLSHFGFLPGGQLGITIQDDGMISIYDLSAAVTLSELTTSSPSHQSPTKVGSLISMYRVGFPVDVFDFRLRNDDGRYLIVGISSYSPFGVPGRQTTVAIIRFDFSDGSKEPIPPKELCRVTFGIDYAQPLVLRGDLLVVQGSTRGEIHGEQMTTLIAIDYKKSLVVQLEDTSLDVTPESSSKLDFTVENDDILLYRFTREMSLELYAYFSISQYMQPLAEFRLGHPPKRIPPDAQGLVDLTPSIPLPSNCIWTPLHICGTPNLSSANRVPLIAKAVPVRSGDSNQEAFTSLAWIDAEGIINQLRTSNLEHDREVRALETFVEGHSYYNHGRYLQPGMTSGWTKYEVGTCARHAFWSRQQIVPVGSTVEVGGEIEATRTTPVVEIVSLPFVGQAFDQEETAKSVRPLQLPLHISSTMSMLKFCDEWGMLACMKSSDQEIQEIHIFDY